MKKLICILLIALLGTTAFAEAPGNSLGFATLERLYDGTGNQLLSPVSLALALSMAADGAKGDTRAEMLNALASESADWAALRASLEKSGLKIANAAFTAADLNVNSDYIARLNGEYAAEWFEMGADIVDKINSWTNRHTDGLIEKLLDAAPDAATQLILLNAVAMDAKWALPFDADATTDATFHAPGGDATVPMMHKTAYLEYGETEIAQLLRLRYLDSDLTMLLALPLRCGGALDISARKLGVWKKPNPIPQITVRQTMLAMPGSGGSTASSVMPMQSSTRPMPPRMPTG